MEIQDPLQPKSAPREPLQEPVASLPTQLWDAVVVGAGPAGSTAAFHLARRGHHVLLVDRETFPREKVCGDGLLADAAHALRRMGVYEEVCRVGHPIRSLSIFSPSLVEIPLPGDYLTVRRQRLDAILAGRAVEEGARFAHGEACDFRIGSDGCVALWFANSAKLVRARVGILATGARATILKRLRPSRQNPKDPKAVALRCYVRSPARLETMVFSYHRSLLPGYAWIIPMGGSEYNVGCGVFACSNRRINLAKAFKTFADEFPVARSLLERCQRLSPMQGAQLRCGLRGVQPLLTGNVLAVGEAVGSTYPLTGEGVGKAMETGELAAEAVHRALVSGDLNELQRYSQGVEAMRERYRAYEVAQRWVSSGWLSDFVARRAHKSPYLRSAVARVLEDAAAPIEIFSLSGILRSFFQ